MEMRVDGIQPMGSGPWVKHDQNQQVNQLIQPVAGGEAGSKPKLEDDGKSWQLKKKSSPDSRETKDLIKEVQSYLEDLDIQFDFSVSEKTGDLVIKVIDRETGNVIRQIPPDDLMALREKLKELRGVLLDGKA